MTSLDFPVLSRPSGRIGQPPEVPSTEDPEEWFTGGMPFTMGAHGFTAHDPTCLMEAVAELEARRAAIEWLLEADLLRCCLV